MSPSFNWFIAIAIASARSPDFGGVRTGGQNLTPDRRGVFGSGIVVSNNGYVGTGCRNRAHLGTFALVAVTAGTKDDHQAPGRERAQ